MGTKKDKSVYSQEDLSSEDLALHYWGTLSNSLNFFITL